MKSFTYERARSPAEAASAAARIRGARFPAMWISEPKAATIRTPRKYRTIRRLVTLYVVYRGTSA